MDASGVAALVRLYQRCPHRDCTLLIDRCWPKSNASFAS